MKYRLNENGDDITDCGEAWSNHDCEIVGTNYNHPSITTGQHTNGPLTYWIRLIGGEWTRTKIRNFNTVRNLWIENGIKEFKND